MRAGDRVLRKAVFATCILVLVAAAYLLGAVSASRNLWPMALLRAAAAALKPPAGAYDGFGRLAGFPGKAKVPCPRQEAGTAVLLVIGQSNAANHAAYRHASPYPDRAVNYFGGRCYAAASPLLGSTGEKGEFITLLADRMLAAELYERVVVIASSIGGSSVSRWEQDGDLNDMLAGVLAEAGRSYRITQVIWHQGEEDAARSTSAKIYARQFRSLMNTLVRYGVDAPVFLAVTTRCGFEPGWRADNPVAVSQRGLVDGSRIVLGVDADELLGEGDRRADGCHLSESGQRKVADAYFEAIRRHLERHP